MFHPWRNEISQKAGVMRSDAGEMYVGFSGGRSVRQKNWKEELEEEQGEEKAGRNWSEWALILNIQHYQQQLHLVLLCFEKNTSMHSIYFIWKKEAPTSSWINTTQHKTLPNKPPRKQVKQWSTEIILSFLSPVNHTPTLWARSDSPDQMPSSLVTISAYSLLLLLLPWLDVAK